MNGYDYIKAKQIAWAKRKGFKLIGSKKEKGVKAYVEDYNQNLFEPLLPETIDEIKLGDGGELRSSDNNPPKISAAHSSVAIMVNVFQYWKDKNIPNIAYALDLCKKNTQLASSIRFEQKFEVYNETFYKPNIDVVIYNKESKDIQVLAIESKFSEAYSSKKTEGLNETYITKDEEQWKDIPNLYKLAKEIFPKNDKYNFLDAAQLIRHILGLKKEYEKKGFRFLYLWYDVPGKEGCKHREELEEFTEIAKQDGIHFHTMTYQKLIIRLNENFYEGNEAYLDYISERYL